MRSIHRHKSDVECSMSDCDTKENNSYIVSLHLEHLMSKNKSTINVCQVSHVNLKGDSFVPLVMSCVKI